MGLCEAYRACNIVVSILFSMIITVLVTIIVIVTSTIIVMIHKIESVGG